MEKYTNATVEWHSNSTHGTVALRVGTQVAKFAGFTNKMGLMVAICAGQQNKRVDFKTSGIRDGHWQDVVITKVEN